MKKIAILTLAALTLGVTSCRKEGCTEPTARNYNEKAKKDDGSCEIVGCMDEHSSNYNADANIDSGECEYPDATIKINFVNTYEGTELEYDNMKYMCEAGHEYSVEKLLYFVSDIVIHGTDGDISLDKAYYIDGKDEETLSTTSEVALPAGTYSGISLVFGLKGDKNEDGTYPNAPEVNMEWPMMMGGGYHFMKFEGKYDSLNLGITTETFATHIGTTSGTSYAFDVDLDKEFTIQGEEEVTFNIEMDVNQWYESPNTYDFRDYGTGIMGNAAAQQELNANGKNNLFSLKSVDLPDHNH